MNKSTFRSQEMFNSKLKSKRVGKIDLLKIMCKKRVASIELHSLRWVLEWKSLCESVNRFDLTSSTIANRNEPRISFFMSEKTEFFVETNRNRITLPTRPLWHMNEYYNTLMKPKVSIGVSVGRILCFRFQQFISKAFSQLRKSFVNRHEISVRHTHMQTFKPTP